MDQQIDIYFNFVGKIELPQITEEIENQRREELLLRAKKKQEREKRAYERKKEKRNAIKEAAEAGDPEASLLYEQILEKERKYRLLYPCHKDKESAGGKKERTPLTDDALIEKYESDLAKKRDGTRALREKQKAAMQAAAASTQEVI